MQGSISILNDTKTRDRSIYARSVCLAQYPYIREEYPLNGGQVVLNFVNNGTVFVPWQIQFSPSVRTVIIVNDAIFSQLDLAGKTCIMSVICAACDQLASSCGALARLILPRAFDRDYGLAREQCQFLDLSLPEALAFATDRVKSK